MLNRRAVSAAIALLISAFALISETVKIREDIENMEARKKNRTYKVKETNYDQENAEEKEKS